VAAPELHPSLVVRHDRGSGQLTRESAVGEGGEAGTSERAGERSEGRTSWNCRVPAKHPAVRGAIQRAAFLADLTPSHSEAAQVNPDAWDLHPNPKP
jgi:hypothetical protein